MLINLIKYDLKNILRHLSIFYILGVVFAVLTRVFLAVDNSIVANIIGSICSGVSIAMIFNILINNLINCWVRFRQSMYGDESYLTHTLPVSKKELYLSKFLLAFATMFVSLLVIILILFIAYYSKENLEFLKNLILPIANIYDSSILALVVVILLIFFLEIFNILQSGYTGMILGHRMNNNKIAFSFLYGFIAYTVTQIFALFVIFIGALINKDVMNLFVTNEMLNIDIIKFVVIIAIIIYTLCIICYYFLNQNLLKKGVNID